MSSEGLWRRWATAQFKDTFLHYFLLIGRTNGNTIHLQRPMWVGLGTPGTLNSIYSVVSNARVR